MVLGIHIMVKKIGQGRENTKIFLKNNPDIANEIENQIREHYGFKPIGE